MPARPIYLDHHATTPLDPRVLEAMLPYFGPRFGNAASRTHLYGWEAEKAVERARQQVAALAGAAPREIVFTSGATESDNLALKGIAEAAPGGHIVSMTTEHPAVLDALAHLERHGFRITLLPPEPDGRLSPARLRDALAPDTILVSVMFANSEIGVLQPIAELAEICRERGIPLHSDAAQAFGKVPLNAADLGASLISLSAHKMYGPKGVGALYVRRREPRPRLVAQMDGGGQESGLRSGTLNVPGIVGFGEACAICSREMDEEATRLAGLRDRLLTLLQTGLSGVRVNGSLEHRLPGNLNVSIEGVDAQALLTAIPELALSTGSACSSANPAPSRVLKAIGVSDALARASIRIGLGRGNTPAEVEQAAARIVEAAARLRALRP